MLVLYILAWIVIEIHVISVQKHIQIQVFSMFVCNIKQANIYDAPQTIQRDWHLWCIYDVGVDLSSSTSLSGAYVGTST